MNLPPIKVSIRQNTKENCLKADTLAAANTTMDSSAVLPPRSLHNRNDCVGNAANLLQRETHESYTYCFFVYMQCFVQVVVVSRPFTLFNPPKIVA